MKLQDVKHLIDAYFDSHTPQEIVDSLEQTILESRSNYAQSCRKICYEQAEIVFDSSYLESAPNLTNPFGQISNINSAEFELLVVNTSRVSFGDSAWFDESDYNLAA